MYKFYLFIIIIIIINNVQRTYEVHAARQK